MSQSTIFQLCRDGSSWVEPILSKDKCVLLDDTTQKRRWGSNPRPLGSESSTLSLIWNGSGWYGSIRAILASTTDSVQWYTFMLSVIFIWEYNFIGSSSSVGGKPSCSSRVREFHCDPTKVHYFLEIGHENRYTSTFIRHLPLIQEGFLSVSSESMCIKYCFIPLFHTGPESHETPRIDKYFDSWGSRRS